jgi:cyclopropane-fatty-acyl-phospholipid synthase
MVRVAVIGAGVGGLSAASTLVKQGFDVLVLEQDAHIGGHAYTKTVRSGDHEAEVDCGFMVFNNVTYTNMLEWFDEYDVKLEPSDMSFGISVKDGWLEWGSDGLAALFSQKTNLVNPNFYWMIKDILRFKPEVEAFLKNPDTKITLREFVQKQKYCEYFVEYYLLPVCGAIWSCPTNTAGEFPAEFILRFMHNHHLLQLVDRPRWSTIAGRTREGYVNKVTAPFAKQILTNATVSKVVPQENGTLLVTWSTLEKPNNEEVFDRVLFACHPPQTLKILGEFATQEQRDYLSAFQYVDNDIWLHSDEKLMPRSKNVWSSWNFLGNSDSKVCVTYWLNRLQNFKLPVEVLLTLNPTTDKYPEASKVFDRFVLSHPVPDLKSSAAQKLNDSIQGKQNMFFCGAWQGYGFHEDGVKSGFAAANAVISGAKSWAPKELAPRFISTYAERAAQMSVLHFMGKFFSKGRLQISEVGGNIHVFGDGSYPHCNITVKSPAFYTNIFLRYDLGIADSYIDGIMETKDLLELFKLLIVNRDEFRRQNGGKAGYLFTSIIGLAAATFKHQYFRRNVVGQTRKNISEHYDLGNEFFKLILDESMSYSAAIFKNPTDTLYEAQMNKWETLAQKARIRPTDRVLEIGFGWGALSILMVKKYGCKVTGLTLSSEQKKYAEDLVAKEGLSHMIDYHLIDYREFNPGFLFDRIVSCEMLEAVGHEFYGDYFSQCQRLMKQDGLLVIQVITVPDHAYDEYRSGVDFIQEYIFPGGLCPSLGALTEAMKKSSEFMVEHLENIGTHYATTLSLWYDNLQKHREKLPSLGMKIDDRFVRIWEYYFKYCEAGFALRVLGDIQVVFTRPNNPNLDYEPVPLDNQDLPAS